MTKGARARARAVREAEAERARARAARRARWRAVLTAPGRAVRALVPGPGRRGRTGRVASRRDRAQVSAVVMGLLVAVVVVFLTIDSWALRIGAVVLALLLAPVLLALTRTDYSRSVR